MSKHVFISHSHKDSAVANSVVTALEQRGLTCWIAPRDVTPGGSYAEAILTAIETASCFVLIYSEHSNMSSHVLREVERALKFGVNIVPVRFDDSTPSKSLDYLLATVHWLAIPAESRDHSIARAAEQIAEWLTNFLKNPATPLPMRPSTLQAALVTSLESPRRRHGMLVGTTLVLALLAAGAYATGMLPFPKKENKAITASDTKLPAAPAAMAPAPGMVPTLGAANRDTAPKVRRSLGYAETVVRPGARSNTSADRNILSNQPLPPSGPPMSQQGNGIRAGIPPDGHYPPPPPPPPGPDGRPMFGPPNGPRGGQPPNPGGPRP
jgi:hypothetical protein